LLVTPRHVLLALSVALPLAAFGAAALYDHDAVVGRAEADASSTADALAEHARAVMETVNSVLSRIEDRVTDLDWPTIDQSQDIYRFLVGVQQSLPEAESVFLVDPAGFNSLSSRMFPMKAYDDRQREYYLNARNGAGGLFISAPFAGQAAGTLAFTISRALHKNGAFNGVVAVTLHPSYFQGFYSAVLKSPSGVSASLVRRDGVIVVHSPQVPAGAAKLPADAPLMQQLTAGIPSGEYWGTSAVTGVRRLVAFQSVTGSDLTVTYARDASAVLRPWYFHLAVLAALAGLAAVSLFFAVWGATARYEREQANLRALIAEQERRRAAEEGLQRAQRLEALGRLTGGLAHDFNNILAGLLGAFQILQRYVSDPKAKQIIEHGIAAANRGAEITAQMLTFAQRRQAELQAVDLPELLRGLDDLIRRTAGPLCRVTYDVDATVAPVLVDGSQLELALLNLVANGRDAMPDGGELTIAVRNGDERRDAGAADFVVVSVADTGVGMSDETRAKAFEPFFTTKAPGKGTGLGLSNVYSAMTQTGGRAVIDSQEGKGTVVRLYLPRAGKAAPAAVDADASPPPALDPLRILLVDDEPLVRETTEGMLIEGGHSVIAVASAREALDILGRGEIVDLLLVDYAMPVQNGAQLASEVKRLRPGLPILFVTGYVKDDGLRIWAETGHIVLQKPYTLRQLLAAIDDAVGAAEEAAKIIPLSRA